MAEIFSGLTRGVPGLKPREMEPPSTCFEDMGAGLFGMPPSSLTYSNLGPGKIFLGVVGATMQTDEAGKPYAMGGTQIGVKDDRHIVTVAGSRSGKSRAVLGPALFLYEGSCLVIDPKGELAEITAMARARTQRVCVIDPFNTTNHKLPANFYTGFNPIARMHKGPAAIEDALLITDALVVQEGSRDPHWNESAKTFIEGVVLDVLTADRFERNRNLVTVRDLIAEGDKTATPKAVFGPKEEDANAMDVLEHFMLKSKEPMVRRAAADFFERPSNERESVMATTRRHLRVMAFPEIEASLKIDGFDLADLKKSKMTVYLCLPGRHIGTCGRWLRLFINLALQAMEATPGKPDIPVLFAMDEFASLGYMHTIENAAAQLTYTLKLWPILQDLGQLKALYGDRWETFMGNAGVLQFFGNNDLTTLEWISKRLGNTTIETLSSSAVSPADDERGGLGQSYAPHTVPVMEPSEAAMFFGREDPLLRQLVIQAGFNPMILQRAYWDKHERFDGLRP